MHASKVLRCENLPKGFYTVSNVSQWKSNNQAHLKANTPPLCHKRYITNRCKKQSNQLLAQWKHNIMQDAMKTIQWDNKNWPTSCRIRLISSFFNFWRAALFCFSIHRRSSRLQSAVKRHNNQLSKWLWHVLNQICFWCKHDNYMFYEFKLARIMASF